MAKLSELLAKIGTKELPEHFEAAKQKGIKALPEDDDVQIAISHHFKMWNLGRKNSLPAPINYVLRNFAINKQEIASHYVGLMDLRAELAEMQKRLVAVEQQAANQKWVGVWQKAQTYLKFNSVTYGGSMWMALRDNPGQPGEPDSGWQLAVRAGRDRRD